MDDDGGSNTGSAYIFDVATGQELLQIDCFRTVMEKRATFSAGASPISGDRADCWGLRGTTTSGSNSGSAYIFGVTTGQELFKLIRSDGEAGDAFSLVGISGDRAIVGAKFDDDNGHNSGSAYVFSVPQSQGMPFCFGDALCPCTNPGSPPEGCANSSGSGAVLTAAGSVSAGADDLVFTASNLLPSQPALLFVGTMPLGIPFGDGLRCVGGGVVRLGIKTPAPSGEAIWGPYLAAIGSWGFQVWYRDPMGPCGSGFNLTNGVEIQFAP